ncbi:Uncharacterized membrane protein [Hathewaya proteolytica DSM 3090]|uniref:Uncharacterized membrane protein n=1 Tax=Hathewaya proteolytica DSM 3090 TaxID=1121331 RepID=A0A1M6NXM5_9CLOT|nr:YibE/F family protein [Hathewaya proteolytica]SHK00443.1 Uncharacterized membrane protein [Hathewaya proteolytica DSM 3090]
MNIKKEIIFITCFLLLIIALIILPTGFEKQIYVNAEGVKAKVISVDNSGIYNTGIIKQGDQKCLIEIQSGQHKGEKVNGVNLFTGKLEMDKIFVSGDTAWVLLERDKDNNIVFANMVDHYRINKEIILIGIFVMAIITISGFTGIRTLLSFAFALLTIWKVLIPFTLKGFNPLIVALIIGNFITIATLILVAGFTKKAYAAILSSMICSVVTCGLAICFGKMFNIHGAVMQWSESLLYAGFMKLDLTAIFQAGIYLACSGAILDLSIDISAALDEIVLHNPEIRKKDLIKSGLTIGKSVVGSQTTTLLLAYMGSYITVMMVYMAQGTPMMSILNSKTISSEILHTFVGCIGLVLVSPLTSIICGNLYYRKNKRVHLVGH